MNSGIYFNKHLLDWHHITNKRHMPWKGLKNPYLIWLSEVILQQTRVAQGLSYYEKIVKTFPTITSLANAKDEDVFKLWEGLGYYSRCRNMLHTARYIAFELDGKFPVAYQDILELKGVGPYTAAAIASFAYALPHAVVDGNVMRVLARFFGSSTPIDTTQGRKWFNTKAEDLLDKKNPGIYNQAIMDFGATVCTPKQPLCPECPLRKKCIALHKGLIGILPVKAKKLKKETRYFYFGIIIQNDMVLIRERTSKDIWQNLNEFFLAETTEVEQEPSFLIQHQVKAVSGITAKIISVSDTHTQLLTHRKIVGNFTILKIREKAKVEGYTWVKISEIKKLAFPRFITSYLENNPLK